MHHARESVGCSERFISAIPNVNKTLSFQMEQPSNLLKGEIDMRVSLR